MNERKRRVSIIFNFLIVILEVVGLFVTFHYNHRISYEYYTEDSNILAMVSSFLLVIFLFRKKEIPRWLQLFKYVTTVCLTVTFLIVLFVLAPMYHFNYGYMFFYRSLLYQHLLCPILSIISFLFFDDLGILNKKDIFFGIHMTVIYAVILTFLNILELVDGPYPFLRVRNQSILISVLWFIMILGFAYFIAFVLRRLYEKFRKV